MSDVAVDCLIESYKSGPETLSANFPEYSVTFFLNFVQSRNDDWRLWWKFFSTFVTPQSLMIDYNSISVGGIRVRF